MHDNIKASHARASDILSPSINVVHLRRLELPPPPSAGGSALRRLVAEAPGLRARAPAVPVRDPEAVVAQQLLRGVRDAEASGFLLRDICSTVELFGRELGGCWPGAWVGRGASSRPK